jgi:homoserine dehydrogenase
VPQAYGPPQAGFKVLITPVNVALFGYGPVARDFVQLVAECASDLRRRYGVRISITGIRGADQQIVLDSSDRTEKTAIPRRDQWQPAAGIEDFLIAAGASIVVQAIPSSEHLVETATAQALAAFEARVDVVTATKSHLARRWGLLADAASRTGCRIRISAATGAALPAADVARLSLRGFRCLRIRGALNGTSTFVLERLGAGDALADAIAVAQSRGIAEADPTGDLDGSDAASKLVLLANLLWDLRTSLDDVPREGIVDSSAIRAVRAVGDGRRLRSVAAADGETGRLEVRLETLSPGDPLYALSGAEKAVAYDCGEVGEIIVSGGRSSLRGASQALLKDVLGLALDGGPAGFH